MAAQKKQALIVINNEDELAEHFHRIHNYLRDNYGLYGKSALQFFNFFFVYKLLNDFIMNDKIIITYEDEKGDEIIGPIGKEFAYEQLRKLVTDSKMTCSDSKYRKFIGRLLGLIERNKYLKENIFMMFPEGILGKEAKTYNNINKFATFLDYIDVLDKEILDKYHVSGRIYEYFLGFVTAKNKGKRGGSQIEDLGQFFTSRVVIRFIVALLNPQVDENKNIPSVMDAFCGSGGFLIEYIKYLKYHNPDIDWKKNLKNIHGYDTDSDICKSARVDIMCSTDIFDIKEDCENFIKNVSSSFTEEFTGVRVKYNLTNPPYGGGIMDCVGGDPIRHIMRSGSVNIPFDKRHNDILKGNDKEAMSMLHGMGILDMDGVYAGVLKEGCVFDKSYMKIRKAMIENYSVEYVISVPQDDFINTTTKTSIVIYRNNGQRTKEIKFAEIAVLKDNKKVRGLHIINSETKRTICDFISENYSFDKKDGEYMVVGYDALVSGNYSMNYKNYIRDSVVAKKGFKIVNLDDNFITFDIVKNEQDKYYKPHKARKAGAATDNGIYTFYTSSSTVKKCDFLDYSDKLCIILGTGGIGSLFLDRNFSCSSDNFVIRCKNDELTTYTYYYLKYNWENFVRETFNGSTLKHINKENLNKYKISVPEDIQTIKLHLDKLEKYNEALRALQILRSNALTDFMQLIMTNDIDVESKQPEAILDELDAIEALSAEPLLAKPNKNTVVAVAIEASSEEQPIAKPKKKANKNIFVDESSEEPPITKPKKKAKNIVIDESSEEQPITKPKRKAKKTVVEQSVAIEASSEEQPIAKPNKNIVVDESNELVAKAIIEQPIAKPNKNIVVDESSEEPPLTKPKKKANKNIVVELDESVAGAIDASSEEPPIAKPKKKATKNIVVDESNKSIANDMASEEPPKVKPKKKVTKIINQVA